MSNSLAECLPADTDPQVLDRLKGLVDFWGGVERCLGQAEGTHRGVLEGLLAEVRDILARSPIDLNRVDSLTGEAALRLSGRRHF